jgi:hypothetical protein
MMQVSHNYPYKKEILLKSNQWIKRAGKIATHGQKQGVLPGAVGSSAETNMTITYQQKANCMILCVKRNSALC